MYTVYPPLHIVAGLHSARRCCLFATRRRHQAQGYRAVRACCQHRSRPLIYVVDRGLRANAEAAAGGVRARKQRREATSVSQRVRRRTQAVGGPSEGSQVKGWRMGKREEEAGRRWVMCTGRERGYPSRLARAATGTAGGRRDVEHTRRGPGNARGDLATWGGKERGIAGWWHRGTRTGESCGEARASRAGMACAGCERERGATRDGRAGATSTV